MHLTRADCCKRLHDCRVCRFIGSGTALGDEPVTGCAQEWCPVWRTRGRLDRQARGDRPPDVSTEERLFHQRDSCASNTIRIRIVFGAFLIFDLSGKSRLSNSNGVTSILED